MLLNITDKIRVESAVLVKSGMDVPEFFPLGLACIPEGSIGPCFTMGGPWTSSISKWYERNGG